ncbi:MAG TPA: signal recognition particle receptor subunit alpha, partial [Casimicrobiaceae bacterium]|nr:signal recognition particle receptor subunit alpha [Casimicrobiaceae bacterium]
MFDLFRRKPAGNPAAPAETPAESSVSEAAPTAVAPAPVRAPDAATAEVEKRSWRDRLTSGLGLSRDKLSGALSGVFRNRVLDDEALAELEAALLLADVGVDATRYLLEDLRIRYRRAGSNADPRALLRSALVDLIRTLEAPVVIGSSRPFVIMLAGVNGAGKTT